MPIGQPLVPGEVYGKIKILDVCRDTGCKYKKFNCQCAICNSIFASTGQSILRFQDQGCPDCRKNARDKAKIAEYKKYIGKVYGNLKIFDYAGMQKTSKKSKDATAFVKCECLICGSISDMPLYRVKNGYISECAKCARQNLKIGHEFQKTVITHGTMITAIDGRRAKNKNNSSGHTGVSYNKRVQKYRAYINFRRKQYSLGLYDKLDDAVSARETAERKIYGDFLEWYADNFPEQWSKICQTKRSPNKQ